MKTAKEHRRDATRKVQNWLGAQALEILKRGGSKSCRELLNEVSPEPRQSDHSTYNMRTGLNYLEGRGELVSTESYNRIRYQWVDPAKQAAQEKARVLRKAQGAEVLGKIKALDLDGITIHHGRELKITLTREAFLTLAEMASG